MSVRWLSVLLLASCSASEQAPASDFASSPRAVACTELATAMCERYAACAPDAARVGAGVGAVCVSALRDHCLRTAGLGGSARNVEAVKACASTTRALACPAFLMRFPDVCEPTPGSRGLTSACAFDEQCMSGFCGRERDSACGVCLAPRAEGEPCIGGACGGALVCNSANACARPGALGETCGPNTPCERLLFCDVDRCAPRKAIGEACAGVGQCDQTVVATCSEAFKCRAATIVALGAECSFIATGQILCEAPARCIAERCAAAKPEGASCTSAHECEGFGAECIRGRCVQRVVEACD